MMQCSGQDWVLEKKETLTKKKKNNNEIQTKSRV